MEVDAIHSIDFDIDIWCDCGYHFNIKGDEADDCTCPGCGAVYSVLPVRVDGA